MSKVQISDDVLLRSLPDEMVLLNVRTGRYYGLNRTGARILELIAAAGDTCTTAEQISKEFGIPIREASAEIAELCKHLESHSLIKTVSCATSPPEAGRLDEEVPEQTHRRHEQ